MPFLGKEKQLYVCVLSGPCDFNRLAWHQIVRCQMHTLTCAQEFLRVRVGVFACVSRVRVWLGGATDVRAVIGPGWCVCGQVE